MTSVLNTLVGQATGRTRPRLRPRVPSLFEGALEAGATLDVTHDARSPVVEPQNPGGQPEGVRQGGPRAGGVTEEAPRAAQFPLLPPQRSPGQSLSVDPAPAHAPAAISSPRSKGHPAMQPPDPAPTPPAATGWQRPTLAEGPRSLAETPATASAPRQQWPPPTEDHADDAPPQLLPQQEPDRRGTAEPASHAEPPQPASPSHAAVPAAPEITIHIGRIDLRQPASPQVRKKTARPDKPATSLSDYLNGSGG
jgi:hypothetical protein